MSTTVMALIVIGAVQTITLVLLARTVRRLAEVAQNSGATGSVRDGDPGLDLLVGRPIPPDDDVTGGTPALIGFFSADCAPCHDQAPRFSRLAADTASLLAVAVVAGPAGAAHDELVDRLDRAMVVTAERADRLLRAYEIRVFPTMIRTNGRRIQDAAVSTDELTVANPAR